jgi:hypothetical protein
MQHSTADNNEFNGWPRRLLHVESMTSYEWQKGNQYGPVICPAYATLSYTWGRRTLKDDEHPTIKALLVEGITWDIPRINEDLFKVSQFEAVIKQCVEAYCDQPALSFLWLDVACINQRDDSPSKRLEIGRQAEIFRRASRSFEWLVGQKEEDMEPWSSIEDVLDAISLAGSSAQHFLSGMQAERSKLGLSFQSSTERMKLQHALSGSEEFLSNAGSSLGTLTNFLWFSSTWTLQEAFLRD